MNSSNYGNTYIMTKPPKSDIRSADEIARTLKLDKGLGFLVRLLDTRVHLRKAISRHASSVCY